MTEEFKEWAAQECGEIVELAFEEGITGFPWDMQWGMYQKFFWENKRWWISIYPYTDKFGGQIRGFWDEEIMTRAYITNVPEQAQRRLVEDAFKILKRDEQNEASS
jgi:hypothetical protein